MKRYAKYPNVRTGDGRPARTRALPDDRVEVLFDDGSSLIVNGDQIEVKDDGTYVVAVTQPPASSKSDDLHDASSGKRHI